MQSCRIRKLEACVTLDTVASSNGVGQECPIYIYSQVTVGTHCLRHGNTESEAKESNV